MITIKNKLSIRKMEEAGAILSSIFDSVVELLKPGMNAFNLDAWIEQQLRSNNLVSRTKGYMGYKHVSCISVNDEVVHGVPTKDKIFKIGDLVKVDVCASYKEYCADMARSFIIGESSSEKQRFIEAAQKALNKGISKAVPGNYLSDISAAIQEEIESYGYGIVRDFAGHGIGKQMHEDPEILNYKAPGKTPVLLPGMAFAIEPMITMGSYKVYVMDDGWTVKTVDKSLAAHVEDTIIITEHEPKIITRNNLANGSSRASL